jgi:plasmid stability protein
VAALQLKNMPDELHAALRSRAAEAGLTLTDYVTRLLHRDLSRPSMAQWLARRGPAEPRADVDGLALIDAVRAADRD